MLTHMEEYSYGGMKVQTQRFVVIASTQENSFGMTKSFNLTHFF